MALKNINTIAVIMFGLLGDVLIRTPVLRALKEIYPKSKVVAVCDNIAENILRDNPYVNEIITIDKKSILSKIMGAFKVKKLHCDLIIDLYNGGSSSNITLFSGARYRLGYKEQKNSKYYNILSEGIVNKTKSVYSYYEQIISILTPLSSEKFNLQPFFYISQRAKDNVNGYLEEFNFNKEKLYTLNLGSGGSEKILDYQMYYELIAEIYKKYGYIPAIVLNPSQEYLQESLIEEYLKPNAIPYIQLKSMSLEEIGALIVSTKFIITPDTGILHIAMSCNSAILGIFNYTHPCLVDYGYEKLMCSYDSFDDGQLWQTQDISAEKLLSDFEILIKKGNM